MQGEDKNEVAASAIRKLWEKHGIKSPLKFLGFCLSLLPIPVIAPAGQILDRHLSDKEFENSLSEIWQEIIKINENVEKTNELEKAINEIAEIVNGNKDLIRKTEGFITKLGQVQKEFLVITEGNSFQELLNTTIKAKKLEVIANNKSENFLQGVSVSADQTILRAINGSSNRIHNSTFSGVSGEVMMSQVEATGSVSLTGNKTTMHPGSNLRVASGGSIKIRSKDE